MAAYFWVGGAGDLNDPSKWSLTSGGVPAGVAPSFTDDVTFNTLSGTNFIVTGIGSYRSFTTGAGATPQFDGVGLSTNDGNFTLSAATTFVGNGSTITTSNNTLSSYTVNLGNASLAGLVSISISALLGSTVTISGTFNNAGEVVIFGDSTSTINLGATVMTVIPGSILSGGVSLNGNNGQAVINCNTASITAYSISLCNANGTVNLNSSTCTATQQLIDQSFSGFGTLNAGTSTIRLISSVTDPALSGAPSFIPKQDGTGSYNIVQFQGDVKFIQGSFTCATMTVTTNANNYGTLILDSNITVSGTLTLTGNSATNRLYVYSRLNYVPSTITATTKVLTNVDFSDVTAVGTAWTGTSLGDCLGNTNITFTTPVTRYAVAAGNWNSTAIWSATSGGAAGASVPLPQDTAILNSQSGVGTIATNTVRVLGKNVNILSGYNGTFSLDTYTATTNIREGCFVYGDFFLSASATLSIANQSYIIVGGAGASTLNITNQAFPYTNSLYLAPRPTGSIVLTGAITNGANSIYVYSEGFDTGGYNINSNYISNTGSIPITGWLTDPYFYNGISNYLRSSLITTTRIDLPGGTDAGTSTIVLIPNLYGSSTFAGVGNPAYNVYINNTVSNYNYRFTSNISNIFSSNTFPYASTNNFNIIHSFTNFPIPFTKTNSTITIDNIFDIGSVTAPVTISDTTITNNSSKVLETSYVYYYKCTAAGSFGGDKLRAFGAANMGQNTNIVFPTITKTYAYNDTGSTSFTVPSDFTNSAFVLAIGGGGSGRSPGGGGGGGAVSVAPLPLSISPLSPGNTLTLSATTSGSAASSVIDPRTSTTIAQANRGSTAASASGGAGGTAVVGTILINGGVGGSGSNTGGGGGGGAINGFTGGLGNASGGGGGGAGTSGNGTLGVTYGGNGGATSGGTGGSYPSPTAGGNATAGTGGGGGGGAAGSITNATKSGTYSRVATTATLTIDITSHGMNNGQQGTFTFTSTQTGTYSRSGTLVTCTRTSHGLSTGQVIYFDATSGGAADGYYTVTTTGANTFTFNHVNSGSTSGNFTIRVQPATATVYTVTVVNANQLTINTTSTAVMSGTVSVTYAASFINAGNGGVGSSLATYSYSYLNNVLTSGSIGPGGGGGGGGEGFATLDTISTAGNGASGLIGSGGGGGGFRLSGVGTGGTGGTGLIIITYALAIPPAQASIVG